MTATSVDSCQFVVLRSPRGRYDHYDMAIAYTHARALNVTISAFLCAPALDHDLQKIWIQLPGPQPAWVTTRPQTYPRESASDLHPKSK